MIIGDLKDWEQEQHAFSPVFQNAVDFIRNNDLLGMQPGRYEILGPDLYALVQEATTVASSERQSECHGKYVDFQYLIDGEEEIFAVARQSDRNVPVEDQLVEGDYVLYDEVHDEMEIVLKPGMFAVFFPSDLHRPACCRRGETRLLKKVVFKVNLAILTNG